MNYNIKDLIDKSEGWPGMNPHAFASLCERVDDCLTLVSGDSGIHLQYIFQNDTDGTLLKSPFQCLYNLRVDFEYAKQITLFFNNTPLEISYDPETTFEFFNENFMFPLEFMKPTDELRIDITLKRPCFVPKKIGSARLVRCNFESRKACLVSMSQKSAMMFDGYKLNCVSNIVTTMAHHISLSDSLSDNHSITSNGTHGTHSSSLSTDIQELVDNLVNDEGSSDLVQSVFRHIETTNDVHSLRRHVNKKE